jgi:urease accessory protein
VERFAGSWSGSVAYPVAVAITVAGHGIPLAPALHAYLHAIAANLISAGVRLIPLGQTDGQRLLATLQEIIEETGDRALASSLDDLGSAAFRVDLAGMCHESQYTRLFRS